MAFYCPVFRQYGHHGKGLWCKQCQNNPALKGDRNAKNSRFPVPLLPDP